MRLLVAFILFASPLLSIAGTRTVTVSGAGGSATMTYDDVNATLDWSYSFNGPITSRGAGWLYLQANATDVYPTGTVLSSVFDRAWESGSLTNSGSGRIYLAGVTETRYYRIYYRTMNSNTVVSGTYTSALIVTNPMTQTCTLSPDGGSAALVKGQSFSGQASGAQSGNKYNISIISGPGSAAIDQTTGAYTIFANDGGLIAYKVWISEGGAYARSADTQAVIAVTIPRQVRVSLPGNTGDYPINYRLVQNGNVIGTHTQQPGEGAYILTVPVTGDGDVTLHTQIVGLVLDGPVWVEKPGSVTDVTPSTPPVIAPVPPNDTTTPPTTITPPPAVTAPPTVNAPPSGPVWTAGNGNSTDSTQQKDLLTNSVFREGIDKITAQEKKLLDEQKRSNTVVEEKLGGLFTLQVETKEDGQQKKAEAESLLDGLKNQAAQQAADSANSKAASGQSAMSSALTSKFGPAPSGAIPAPLSAPEADFVMLAGKYRMELNPFSQAAPFGGVVGKVGNFVRALISWGLVAAFMIYALKEVSKTVEGLFRVAPFSKSIEDSINSVRVLGNGGGVGYVVRVAALTLVAALVLTMPLIITAALTNELPMATLLTVMSGGAPSVSSQGSPQLVEAAALADRVIPWMMLMVAPAWYVITQYVLIPSRFFWMMFAKFIPL